MPTRILLFQRLAGKSDEYEADQAFTPTLYSSIVGFSMIGLEELDKKV
jgi:hypothetical protein